MPNRPHRSKMLRTDTLDRMQQVYKIMKANAKIKNGLWLDTYGFQQDFLLGPDDTVEIFLSQDVGGLVAIASKLNMSPTRLQQIMGQMKACGFIHSLQRGIHVLLEEPSEESFREAKLRAQIPFQGDGPPSGLRSMVLEYLAGMNARIDLIQTAVSELGREVEALRKKK